VAAVAVAIAAPYLAPIAVSALFGAAAVTATSVAIATALIGLTLSVGLSLAFRALGVGAPSAKNAVGPPSVFRQSITNSFIVYGKRRVGGLLVFFHPRKSGDDHYRYFVIACAGHRCKGVVEWMLNDETVTVDGSGLVTSGPYADNAWLWFQRGLANETANATFVAECGGKWTADHKGSDVAAIYAKFKLTDDVVQAGMPNITAVIEGRDEVYNPASAAGYTRNASRIFYDWMQIPREEGGFGAYADEIPDAAFVAAQANVCDETVNGNARYALDAVITTGAPPNEIRDVMIVNQAGSYTYSGGKHLMRPGYWVPPSLTLSEDDLAGPVQVSPFMAADAAANEVQGTYINPDDGYQGAPFTTQSVASDDVRQIDLDLAFTTVKDQADRVAAIMLKRAQHEKTAVWPMNITGLKVTALDTVQLASTRYGLDNYAWSVASWGLSADWGVVVSLREESADIYDDAPPTAITPPPRIDKAEPILTVEEITALIAGSRTSGLTFSVHDSGAVDISAHDRLYDDKTVAVAAGTAPAPAGAVAGDKVAVFYDQSSRAGGAVAYQSLRLPGGTGSTTEAEPSADHPYRHFVCIGTIPASGGTTSGGSSVGSGGGAGGGYYGGGDIP
jgi:hypothetical protein